MPAPTFYDLWMGIRLSVPNASAPLIQRWTRNAFRELADRRMWSWQLIQGQLVWQDARDLEVTTTFGSTTVTSAALFVAGDVGRNIRVGTYPIYTIAAFVSTSEVTLDRAYEGSGDGVVDAQILDAYATLPSNFEQFVMLLDPVNQRLVPWWATWDEMSLLDPIRACAESTPRLLGAAIPSTYSAALGQTQYEYYPKPLEHGALQYYAKALPTLSRDSDPIPGNLAARTDVLETHVLMQAARWPGTIDQKNPYFNLALARDLRQEFERAANQLDIRDDDVYQQSFDKIPWQRWSTYAWAFDTHLLQQTDATLGDYAGYGLYY
jgi:hypothetical protein